MENETAREFVTPGYEDMELSTQVLIKESLRRGIEVEILDRTENFIKLSKHGKSEYIKQATRTSADSYMAALIMENKHVTKSILEQAAIVVPKGELYSNYESACNSYKAWCGKSLVIKPNNTNFGKGITIILNCCSNSDFENALKLAFSFDSSVIIENYKPGKEYRFLVIAGQVVGVLHRAAANVTGDGIHTIAQLIDIKNSDPLRGKGYKLPLEKIKKGQTEREYLALTGLGFSSIPQIDQVVYLRKNSNISTGGDSLDMTDEVDESYKQIALAATRAVGAIICGADMIIEDIKSPGQPDNYAVIELNFNPAIHIHDFPYRGSNRYAEKKILDLLGF